MANQPHVADYRTPAMAMPMDEQMNENTSQKRGDSVDRSTMPSRSTAEDEFDFMAAWGRMFTAHRQSLKLVTQNPMWRDADAEYEAARAWPLVVVAYNSIEQAMKLLVCASTSPKPSLDDIRRQYGHDLGQLYRSLQPEDREHIESHYREHMSLMALGEEWAWDFPTAQDFILNLNRRSGQHGGSIAWRYLLLDMNDDLPKISLWTMCELWTAICCQIKGVEGERSLGCECMSRRLCLRIDKIVNSVCGHSDFDLESSIAGLNEWIARSGGSRLCAYVELLSRAERGEIGELLAPAPMTPMLTKMAEAIAERMSSDSALPDERLLIRLVRSGGRSLRWDPSLREFRWA